MNNSLSKTLIDLRKAKGFTQEDVALKLGVTPQAVSKWENDISCPDIMLLPKIAKLYGTSIDALLGNVTDENVCEPKETKQVENVDYNKLFLYVYVDSDSDHVKVKLPIAVIKQLIEIGLEIPDLSKMIGVDIRGIKIDKIFALISSETVGELVNVQSDLSGIVRVIVEE